MSTLPVTERTKVKRHHERGAHDRATIDAILDEALVCHVAFATERGPVVIPTTHARMGDRLVIHGSAASYMLRSLASGIDVSVCVTLLDALVLARTAFHHSVNYRSVVVFGRAELVDETTAKLAALAAIVDRVAPGRSAACRPPNAKELTATTVLAMPLTEASAKIRTGPPLLEDGEDAMLPYWSGVVPLVTSRGAPLPATDCAFPWPH